MFLSSLRSFCKRQRIFISYASEDRAAAEELAHTLLADGHTVFFDASSLKGSENFTARIREEIRKADRAIFLLSKNSVAPGSYALTELGFTQLKWQSAAGRVMPVFLEDVPIENVPPYLRAVHIVRPKGNLSGEVAEEILRTATLGPRCWAIAAVALLFFGSVAAGFIYSSVSPSDALDGVYSTRVTLTRSQRLTGEEFDNPGCKVGRDHTVVMNVKSRTISFSASTGKFTGELDRNGEFVVESMVTMPLAGGPRTHSPTWRYTGVVNANGIRGEFRSTGMNGICSGTLAGTRQKR